MFFPVTRSDSRRQVAELVVRCPLHPPVADCPLQPVRELGPRERAEWLRTRSEAEAVALCRHHAHCYRRRIGDI